MRKVLLGLGVAAFVAATMGGSTVSAAPKAKDCWKHWDADLAQYVAVWVSGNAANGHGKHPLDVNLGPTATRAACVALFAAS